MRAHGILAAVAGLALALGGCGGRPAPLDRPDGGSLGDATHYDGGRHDGTIRGDAGAKCDDIANGYFSLADSYNYCTVATDCVNYSVDCAIGAYAGYTDCYLYVSRSADTSQLVALGKRWKENGCPGVECHPCTAPPSLTCQGGVCVPGSTCNPESCTSGPDDCCGRDCDPDTFQTCRMVCPPVAPADPLCECPAEGGCSNVWCTSDWGCPDGSRCDPDTGVCVTVPRCEQPLVGCRQFLNHCSCSWSCVDGDADVVDCPSTCPDEQQMQLNAPLCECGAGGCGMVVCDPSTGDCGFGYICNEVPGSSSYTVCAECANC